MSTVLAPFPDAEKVVMDLLSSVGPTSTVTGAVVSPPAILIQRVGGTDDGVTDRPVVQVTCLGATRHDAWDMARQAQQVILASAGTAVTGSLVSGVLVDTARTVTPPDQIPDRNSALRPVAAQYRFGFRRPWGTG